MHTFLLSTMATIFHTKPTSRFTKLMVPSSVYGNQTSLGRSSHLSKKDMTRAPALTSLPVTSLPVPSPIKRSSVREFKTTDETKMDDVVVDVMVEGHASLVKDEMVEARREMREEKKKAIAKGKKDLDSFVEECTPYLQATVEGEMFAAYLGGKAIDDFIGESLPKEARIQFALWNDKPSKKRQNPFAGSMGLHGSALLTDDLTDGRRGRVIAYRFRGIEKGIDKEGCAVFDYGATVYTPPNETIKKYSKAHGFSRPAMPRIPKTELAKHKMTALRRCMDGPVTIRVPFADGFTWSSPCLHKVRKAIRAAMTKPGGCGGCGGSIPS